MQYELISVAFHSAPHSSVTASCSGETIIAELQYILVHCRHLDLSAESNKENDQRRDPY